MKHHIAVIAVVTLSAMSAPASWAQSGSMGSMDMKNMDMSKCKDMMKGSGQCMDMMMKDDKSKAPEKASTAKTHSGTGTVTAMDKANDKVTIAHGPVQTMKWPPMTMTFGVKDKALLEKLSLGKKVDFEFVQQGSDYIVTSAK